MDDLLYKLFYLNTEAYHFGISSSSCVGQFTHDVKVTISFKRDKCPSHTTYSDSESWCGLSTCSL